MSVGGFVMRTPFPFQLVAEARGTPSPPLAGGRRAPPPGAPTGGAGPPTAFAANAGARCRRRGPTAERIGLPRVIAPGGWGWEDLPNWHLSPVRTLDIVRDARFVIRDSRFAVPQGGRRGPCQSLRRAGHQGQGRGMPEGGGVLFSCSASAPRGGFGGDFAEGGGVYFVDGLVRHGATEGV